MPFVVAGRQYKSRWTSFSLSCSLTRRMSKKGITKYVSCVAVGKRPSAIFIYCFNRLATMSCAKLSRNRNFRLITDDRTVVWRHLARSVIRNFMQCTTLVRFSSFLDHPHTASRPTPAHDFFTFHCISSSIRLFFPQFMLRCRERKIVELFSSRVFFINKIDDLDSSRKVRDNAKKKKENRLAKITFAAEINCESEVSERTPSNRGAQISTKRKLLISN